MVKIAYIAGPYSGDIEDNIKRAAEVAIKYWRLGYAVICPHKNSGGFQKYDDEKLTYDTWIAGYIEILKRCDVIVMMETWRKSGGARKELDVARSIGLEIIYE